MVRPLPTIIHYEIVDLRIRKSSIGNKSLLQYRCRVGQKSDDLDSFLEPEKYYNSQWIDLDYKDSERVQEVMNLFDYVLLAHKD